MKRIFIFLSGILLCSLLMAQAPQGISHQAVIRYSSNEVVTNSTVGIRVSILQGSPTGTVFYRETHTPLSNANGLISYIIGQGVVDTGVFANIDWSNGSYYLKTEADPAGGTSYSIIGTTEMLSIPYAFFSQKADTAMNEADPAYTGSQAANITETDITRLGNLSGTNSGNQGLSIDGHLLTISGGNTVQIPDSVNDADADPANEIQTLSLEGYTLSLSDGNSIVIPSCTTGSHFYYADKDGDGFGNRFAPVYVPAGVTQPAGFVLDNTDCDDEDENINPSASEISDGVDNDCDGEVDE